MSASRNPIVFSPPTIVFPPAPSTPSVRSAPQSNLPGRPPRLRGRQWLLAAGLVLLAGRARAQAPGTPSATPGEQPVPSATAVLSPGVLKKMSLRQLMDLDVTSVSKQPEPYGQAPAAIDVITNDEIRRSGASVLPEVLRLADNLEVAQKNSHDWAISARGFNTDSANKLLVLMDGRSVYTPLFSGVFWDVQDSLLADIDRIEVISGPGGTLWGANAVNGVINVITKSAEETQGLYVEGGGGWGPGDLEGVRYGGRLAPGVFYRVYGKYFDAGDEALPNGNDASDSWHMGRGGFRMDARSSPDETFTLQGDCYAGDQNTQGVGDAKTSGGNILGRWSRAFSDGSNMSLQLYYDRTHLSDPQPADVTSGGATLAPSGTLVDDLDTYDLDFQHRFHLNGWNNLIWGLGYRFTHDVVQNAPALAFEPSTLDHNLPSGFAQDEMTLVRDLFLTFGSKVEHNDYTGFEFEPSARLKWDLAAGQMLWTAVSRAVRMPSRVDRDLLKPTPNIAYLGIDNLLVGGADFLSETVVSYELGYRAQLTREFSTSISTFFNQYDELRSTAFSPPPAPLGFPLVFQNNLRAQTGGVEFTADYQVSAGWRLHFGYDLLQENVWVIPGQTDINNALNETADPRNQVFVRSPLDLPGGLELDPDFRWVDSLTYNNTGTPAVVPSYAELDVRLGWHVTPNVEVSVAGQSLLHDHHLEYVISSPAPQEEIRRNVYGKVTCEF